MKPVKSVSSREFQHRFGQMSSRLKPGESIMVTKHGQALGTFTKAYKPRKMPDFMANLEKLGYSVEAGERIIKKICELP